MASSVALRHAPARRAPQLNERQAVQFPPARWLACAGRGGAGSVRLL